MKTIDWWLGFAAILCGALAGWALAMSLIAAQRSASPPAPMDPMEIKRTQGNARAN